MWAWHKVLIMPPEYGWKMPEQTVLTMAGFWICLLKIWQGFEYVTGSKQGQGSKYGKVLNMQRLHGVLNKPD